MILAMDALGVCVCVYDICMCVYSCICVNIYVCMCVYTCVCMYVCVHVYASHGCSVCMCVCMYMSTQSHGWSVCMYVCICPEKPTGYGHFHVMQSHTYIRVCVYLCVYDVCMHLSSEADRLWSLGVCMYVCTCPAKLKVMICAYICVYVCM